VPASADQPITAVDVSTKTLELLDPTKGRVLARLPLRGGTSGEITQIATTRAELLWIGGVSYAVQATGASFLWTRATPSAPTVTPQPSSAQSPTDLTHALIAVTDPLGLVLLRPGTGKTAQTFPVPTPPPGSLAYPFGPGFLLSGRSTTVYR